MISFEKLQEMINKAADYGACGTAIEGLRELTSVEAVLNDPDIIIWVRWYTRHVGFDPDCPEIFPEIEKHLADDCQAAVKHAIKCKKAPFPEAHDTIQRCHNCSEIYLKAFPKAFADV